MVADFCCALYQSCLEPKRRLEGNVSLPASLPNIWKIYLTTPVESILLGNTRIHIRCCHLMPLFQAQKWHSLFSICLLETSQERSSTMVLCRLCRHCLRDQEPVSWRLKLRPLSKGAQSWVSLSYRKKTDQVWRLWIFQTSVMLLFALYNQLILKLVLIFFCYQCNAQSSHWEKTKKPGCTVRGHLFRLWIFGQVLLIQRTI